MKLTKNGLRIEQNRLSLLNKYLPTLQLKKALLQVEVANARLEAEAFEKDFTLIKTKTEAFASLITDSLLEAVKIKEVKKRVENIAGIDVPYLDAVIFEPFDYSLFDTPAWLDSAILKLQQLIEMKEKLTIAREKIQALENEFREVSIRVNLFEKILIPRAKTHVKKIGVFLADQLLAGVARAKVAKSKLTAIA